jgi:hypothetical protein
MSVHSFIRQVPTRYVHSSSLAATDPWHSSTARSSNATNKRADKQVKHHGDGDDDHDDEIGCSSFNVVHSVVRIVEPLERHDANVGIPVAQGLSTSNFWKARSFSFPTLAYTVALLLCDALIMSVVQVLPYCLFNVCLMLALSLIDRYVMKDRDLVVHVSTQGHTFITFIVSYLLLSRVNSGLARYNTARDYLSTMYRESRDLVQAACVFSAKNTDESAQEWRHEMAYRSLLLLRTAMAVVDYPTDKIPAWTVPELNGFERDDVRRNLFLEEDSPARRWAHKPRDEWEETMRVPVRLEYLLQTTLHSQRRRLKVPIQIPQEARLLVNVSNFMVGYYGIRKFLTSVRF